MARAAKKTTAEAVKQAAEAETDQGAMSAAADTQPPVPDAPAPAPAAAKGPSVGELMHRIERLEADIANLRKQFGWPTTE